MRALIRLAALSALLLARAAVADGCARPTDPGGFEGIAYGDATVRSFDTETVRVWYAIDGEDAVNLASSRPDGVPDDVAEVAQVTSDALERYAAMGYRAPVSDGVNPSCGSNGGDDRLDVYLMHMVGADGATFAEPDRCTSFGEALQCADFILAQSNFADFAQLYDSPSIGIRTVLPHEAFHAVQDAYDSLLDRFWAEGTAQWAAKTLDPSLEDLERFLPAFLGDPGRSLDGPPNGVTSAFLYGAALWPVFLTQRHGEEIVRSIFEEEGRDGDAALVATDQVLQTASSSMALEFPRFAAWNVATGTRAGTEGYPDAARYPMVPVEALDGGSVQGITSGFDSFYFHVSVASPARVALETDPARNVGQLVPLVSGVAQLGAVTPLPTTLEGEGIVVVSGITSKKSDAPFTLTLTPIETSDGGTSSPAVLDPGAESTGCSSAPRTSTPGGLLLGLIGLFALTRERRLARHRAPARRKVTGWPRGVAALALALVACSPSQKPAAPPAVAPRAAPTRIVSVGGPVTETVFALGAGGLVVGDDTSSLYPEAATKLPRVGYERTLSAEGVLSLSPSLVIASSEAGPPAVLEQLRSAGVRVELVPGGASVEGAKRRISTIAQLLQRDPAPALAALEADLARARAFVGKTPTHPKVLVLYARGANTLFVFGRGTSADAMLSLAGAENAVTAFEGTRPLTSEAVVQAAPDVILLPSRGLESLGGVDGLLQLPGLGQTPAGKAKRVVTLDDLLLLGFGPRTGEAALQLAKALHSEPAAPAEDR